MKIPFLLTLFVTGLMVFIACDNNSQPQKPGLDQATQKKYMEKGKEIAGQTFTVLAGQLQKALAKGGVPQAIEYCNLAALPLVDSLSSVHKATIRRTSNKVRNPANVPNKIEKEILNQYETQAKSAQPLTPVVRQLDDQTIAFFAPISVNTFCLQCHGKVGETLSEENYQVIQQYYPEDKAVGYVDGAFRGMWSIYFKQ